MERRLGAGHGIAVAVAMWGALCLLQLLGAFRITDLKVSDLRFRLRGERAASEQIALIEVDDLTLAAYKQWPLRRDAYALLLHTLEMAGARAIGMDLRFLTDSSDLKADALLARVTAGSANIVHAISFEATSDSRGGTELAHDAVALLARRGWVGQEEVAPSAGDVLLPYAALLESAPLLGHVQLTVDADGAVRRLPPLIRYEGRVFPAMSLALVMYQSGTNEPPEVVASSTGFRIGGQGRTGFEIPVDAEGSMVIDFAGSQRAFAHTYSMIDVLRWRRAEDWERLRETFRDRIVLVGNTAAGEGESDQGATPFASMTPLLIVHANVVDALLRHKFLRQPSMGIWLVAMGVFSALLGGLLATLSLPGAILLSLLTTFLIASLQQLLFTRFGVDSPGGIGIVLAPSAYLAVASYRYLFLERRARERGRVLAVARDIQRRLLPREPLRRDGLDLFGVNLPAEEIGGDYFDWLPLVDGGVALIVGDVSGKGVPAALLMSHVRASCHAEVRGGSTPSSILSAVNTSLHRATEPSKYATLLLVAIRSGREELIFCNAGHPSGLLVHSGEVRLLEQTGLPLGMFEEGGYEDRHLPFQVGDVLILYSDGVTECARRGDLYGDERLRGLVMTASSSSMTAAEIGAELLADVNSYSQDRAYIDDVTIMVVRRTM